jgi:Tfp pilus assembly protein PilV
MASASYYRSRFRQTSGFTILEVLIALFLVTFTVLALGGFTLKFLQSATGSTNRGLARSFAVEQLEDLRGRPYRQLETLPPSPIPGADGFTRSVTVTRVGGSKQGQDYKIITVEVRPPGTFPVRLTTVVSAP